MHFSPPAIVSDIKAITLRLRPGEDLKSSLDEFAKVNCIKAACIITCVGSLQQAAVRFADLTTATIINGKFEIVSLTGTLADAASHLHIVISDSTGKTIGGHLKEGSLIYTTAEVVIGVLPHVSYLRETDSTFGFKELLVEREEKHGTISG